MNYPEFVRSRFKSGEKIAEEMTPRKLEFLDVSTKTLVRDAESLDNVKKFAYYNKHIKYLCEGEMPQSRFDELKPTPLQCELLHAAIGIAGEAGELLDAVRKHVFDGQPLDGENVIEELGDLNFYFEAACQSIGVTREEIEQENQAKLSKRYEGGYSDQQAQERKDKQ
jgi:NTP pyrophosphatase (non-canonical NTP hydrolase)